MTSESNFKKYQKPTESYTCIPNALVTTKGLTDADIRLLIYLFTNSDDWIVYLSYVRQVFGWGKTKMEKTIAHLCELGYVKRTQVREKGRFHHYDFTYHYEPIFKENCIETCDDTDESSTPTANLPGAVLGPAEKRELPMPNLPMPNGQRYKGNAPKPPFATLEGSGLQAIGDDQALPFNASTTGIGATCNPNSKIIPSTTRRYRRSKAHQEAFDYLMGLDLTDQNGCIHEDSMSVLAHQHSLQRLRDTYAHMQFKLSKGITVHCRIAFFRNLLKKEHNTRGSNADINTQTAKDFVKAFGWATLVIGDKYVSDETLPGKEVPLNLGKQDFYDHLMRMYEVTA